MFIQSVSNHLEFGRTTRDLARCADVRSISWNRPTFVCEVRTARESLRYRHSLRVLPTLAMPFVSGSMTRWRTIDTNGIIHKLLRISADCRCKSHLDCDFWSRNFSQLLVVSCEVFILRDKLWIHWVAPNWYNNRKPLIVVRFAIFVRDLVVSRNQGQQTFFARCMWLLVRFCAWSPRDFGPFANFALGILREVRKSRGFRDSFSWLENWTTWFWKIDCLAPRGWSFFVHLIFQCDPLTILTELATDLAVQWWFLNHHLFTVEVSTGALAELELVAVSSKPPTTVSTS